MLAYSLEFNLTPQSHQEKKVWVDKTFSVYQYDVNIDLKEDTYRAHSKALHRVRSMVSDSKMADHSEGLLLYPERMIKTDVSKNDSYAIEHFRPKGFDNVFVLSGYAGIKDKDARHKLLKSPYILAPIGKEIGVVAAKHAQKATAARDEAKNLSNVSQEDDSKRRK